MGHGCRRGGERAQVLPIPHTRRQCAPPPPPLEFWRLNQFPTCHFESSPVIIGGSPSHPDLFALPQVAIVFRSVAEARVVDGLLGGSVIKPNRPLPLRFCSGSKSFCSGICFGSATDTCCLAHQRPQPPVDIPEPSAKRQRAAETESVLCAFLGDEEEEDDALSFESLRELCNVHEGAEGASDDALPAGSRQPSPVHSDSSRSTVSAPSSPHAEKTWPSSSLFGWSDGVWEPAAADEGDDLFSNLEVLLCEAPCGSASMAVDLDSLSAANYAALACLPSPPAASAPLPPHLSMPSDLLPRGLSLEPARPSAAPCPPRGASPASLKPALPRVKHAARWRPCTDLGPAKPRAPSAVAPSAAPDAKPVAEPGAKPAGKPKNIKSRAIWKSAIVL